MIVMPNINATRRENAKTAAEILARKISKITNQCKHAHKTSRHRFKCFASGCTRTFLLPHFLRFHVMECHENMASFLGICIEKPCRGVIFERNAKLKHAIQHFYDAHFESLVYKNDLKSRGHMPDVEEAIQESGTRECARNTDNASEREPTPVEMSAAEEVTFRNLVFDTFNSSPENNPEAFLVPKADPIINLSVLALNLTIFELESLQRKGLEYPCLHEHCTKSFNNKFDMRRHVLTDHTIHKPSAYACGICGDLFMSEKSFFDVCMHGYAKHYKKELKKQEVQRGLRYLNCMGEDMDTGHFDVLSLLRRIGLKFSDLVPVWFPAHFSIQDSETLKHIEENGVLSLRDEKWHGRNTKNKVTSKRAGTQNLGVDLGPLQNENVNKVRRLEKGAYGSARMLDTASPPLTKTPYINLDTNKVFYIGGPTQNKLRRCSSDKDSSVPVDGNHITSFSQEYGQKKPKLDVAVFFADMLNEEEKQEEKRGGIRD